MKNGCLWVLSVTTPFIQQAGLFFFYTNVGFILSLYFARLRLSCFIAVDDSAILDCHFSDFYHTPPQGFEKILFEQQIFWASACPPMSSPSLISPNSLSVTLQFGSDWIMSLSVAPFPVFVPCDYLVLSLLLWNEAGGIEDFWSSGYADQSFISSLRDAFSCHIFSL